MTTQLKLTNISYHIPVPNVLWKTPDNGQRNCPKHVEFLDKNQFGKISASVGFIKEESLKFLKKKLFKFVRKSQVLRINHRVYNQFFLSMADIE